MAGAFPDVPDYRMVTDIDGTRLRGIAADKTSWEDYSPGDLIAINDEQDGSFIDTATIGDTSAYVFAFPQPRRVTGLFASFTPADQRGPVRNNLAVNPSFEVNVLGWNGYNGAITPVAGVAPTVGTNCARYTSTTVSGAATHRIECAVYLPMTSSHNAVCSVYVTNTGSVSRDFRMRAEAYSSIKASLSTYLYGPTVSIAAGATARISLTATNTGVAHVFSRISVACQQALAIAETYEIDAALLESDPAISVPMDYFDGGSANSLWTFRENYSPSVQTISQISDRTNLCTNPSFEIDTFDWDCYSGTLSISTDTFSPRGGKFLRYTSTINRTTGTPNYVRHLPFIPVTGGDTYSASMWVRCSIAKTVRLFLRANKGLALTIGDLFTDVVVLANVWTYVSVSGVVPATADNLRLHSWIPGGLAVGEKLDLDMVLFENVPAVDTYFDGDSPSSTWIDSPHASASLLPAYNALNWVEVSVDVSTDTTTGVDGTWQNIVIPDRLYDGESYGNFAASTVPGYRSMILGGLNVPSAKALRLNLTGATAMSGWTFNTCHLYGDRAYDPDVDPRYLVFYHPTLNQALFPEGLDFGNVGDGDSQDRNFRLRNLSRTREARDVVITLETLTDTVPSVKDTFLLSVDGGLNAGGQITLPVLPPNGITDVMTLRKATPYTAINGPWTARLHAQVGSWT